MARLGRCGVVFVLALALVGVGGASSSADSMSSPQARPAASNGPATARLTFAGDAGLAGLATTQQVSCNSPNIDGSISIFVLAQPQDPGALFNMQVTARKLSIGVFAGSGTGFRGRSFEGNGLTGFNAAKGVQINAKLTETTASNSGENPGTLGKITSMKGFIHCGNQTTGSSTVAFLGKTADGAVGRKFHPFRVECDTSASSGRSVFFVGVVKVGRKKAVFEAGFGADSINVFESIPGTPPIERQYLVKVAGVTTLSAHGAYVNGDVVEQSPTSGAAHTLHVKGNLTCGATVHR